MIVSESRWKFRRLLRLPEDPQRYMNNALVRGDNAQDVARQLQSWGHFSSTPEKTLAKELARYRMYRLGALKPEPDFEVAQVTGRLQTTRFDAMMELRVLAQQQRDRVNCLLLREQENDEYRAHVSSEITDYAALLKDVLKAEFDCGEREFKGPLPQGRGLTVSASVNPNGQVDVTLRDAVSTAAEILAKHQPRVIEHV